MSTTTKLIDFNKKNLRKNLPDIKPGMKIRVHEKIKDGDKERIQVFEGIVIGMKHGKGISGTMTVRAVISSVGVEKIYPLHSPKIEKIEVVRASKVRQAKLYFLRDLSPKKIKRKLSVFKDIVAEVPAPIADEEYLEKFEGDESETKTEDTKETAENKEETKE